MSNLKCWKNKNISSRKQIFRKIQWQVKIFRNRAKEKTDETDKSYIILMKAKSHLQFRTDSTTTCINKKLRKTSQIRKIKEKINSRTVIKCIRNINKSININWAEFEEQQFKRSVYQNRQKLIWDSLTENKETWH